LKKNNKNDYRMKNGDDDDDDQEEEDDDDSRENQHVLRRFLVAARITGLAIGEETKSEFPVFSPD
jgi:hypothetical protein